MRLFRPVATVCALLFTGCSGTWQMAQQEAQAALGRIDTTTPPETITAADLKKLPPPVQRFLSKAGVVGQQRLRMARMRFEGRIRSAPTAGWIPIDVTQYTFMEPTLTRIFYVNGRMMGFLPVVGRDKYAHGRGAMLIRPLDLFNAVDVSGPAMDKSALVTFLNDLGFMCPTGLLDRRICWEAVNDTAARATLTEGELSVSGIFNFNTQGEMVNFETDDRTYDNGKDEPRRARWSTPIRAPRDFDGIRIPSAGDAIWEFPDGERFLYASMTIQEVKTNQYALYDK